MGMWIFAEYAWNIFVRADLRAQARGHSPRRVKMVLLVVFASLLRLMDKILQYPLEGIYHNSHSLGSLGSCRILSINSIFQPGHFRILGPQAISAVVALAARAPQLSCLHERVESRLFFVK